MENRTFRVSAKNLETLLALLRLDSIKIELPDTKETYQALSTSDIDWEFAEDKNNWVEENIEEEEEKEVLEVKNNEVGKEDPTSINRLATNLDTLATYIEAVYRLGTLSPEIIFGSNLFTSQVASLFDTIGNETRSINHVMLTTFLSTYYNCFLDPEKADIEKIKGDVFNMLRDTWKDIKNHPSLVSYVGKLFKKRSE